MEHGTMIDLENPKIAFAMRMVKNNPFMQWNHIRVTEMDEDHCIGYVDLQPEQKNPNGLAHGGLLFTVSDVFASAVARADGRNYSTLDADVHFLRNVKEGRIYGEASAAKPERNWSGQPSPCSVLDREWRRPKRQGIDRGTYCSSDTWKM